MDQEPDFRWVAKDLREQLGSAIDTFTKLRDQCELVRNKLLFHLDQGEGLTQEQLADVYADIARLFPRRVRKTSETLDAQL